MTTAETQLREHRRATPNLGGSGALRYGPPEVVRITGQKNGRGGGELLVKVHATMVNRTPAATGERWPAGR